MNSLGHNENDSVEPGLGSDVPHLGSFLPVEQGDATTEASDESELTAAHHAHDQGEESDEDMEYADLDDGRDGADLKFRIALIGVAALTVVSAMGFYLSKKPAASGNGKVSAFDSVFMENSGSGSDSSGPNPSDVISVKGSASDTSGFSDSPSQSASTTGSSTHFIVYADTFASSTPVSGKVTSSTVAPVNMGRSTASRKQTLSETYESRDLGISLLADPYWRVNVSSTQNGKVLYFKDVGPRSLDTIVATRFRGQSVTTSDPKNGSVTYFYDVPSSSWMTYRGSMSTYSPEKGSEAVPFIRTSAGSPVFEGTSVVKTAIVALGTDDFLIVNINAGGYLDLFDAMLKSIKEI